MTNERSNSLMDLLSRMHLDIIFPWKSSSKTVLVMAKDLKARLDETASTSFLKSYPSSKLTLNKIKDSIIDVVLKKSISL